MSTQNTALVTVSFGFTCGCTQRPSEPITAIDARSLPGTVIICERHQEAVVCVRVTTRLVHDPVTFRRLLVEAGVDEDVVCSVPLTPGDFPA